MINAIFTESTELIYLNLALDYILSYLNSYGVLYNDWGIKNCE